MASQAGESHQDYEEVKEEHDLYKEKYLQLLKKYEDMAVSCNKDDSDDDEENFEPPAKKQKVYASMEGFGNLPFELIDKIFSYLKPKEILDSMSVSKCWKYFIETRYLNKVMDKVVVKFDKIEEDNEGMVDVITTSSRNFKHVEGKFGIKVANQFPFKAYASSVESLKIICNTTLNRKVEPVDFLKLKKLMIVCENVNYHGCGGCNHASYKPCPHNDLLSFIKASSFPEVTHLRMQFFDKDQITFAQLLAKFPKLKVLLLPSEGHDYTVWYRHMLESYKHFEKQPKVEAICMDYVDEDFLHKFEDSLTEVCIDRGVNTVWLIKMLKNLKNLQSLSIKEFYGYSNRTEPFPRLEKLQSLSLQSGFESLEFKEFLLHLPLLHTLIIRRTVDKSFIEFLAINISSLKKLICYAATKETRKFCEDLKKKKGNDQFIDTNFRIQIETDDDWNTWDWRSFEQIFYNKHFK